MEIEFDLRRSVLLIRLKGELDHHWAEQVREKIDRELNSETAHSLIFNLGGLTFMDSSGIGVLLGRYRRMSAKGRRMAVCDVPPPLLKIIEIAGLSEIIPFFNNEEAALQHLLLGTPPVRGL